MAKVFVAVLAIAVFFAIFIVAFTVQISLHPMSPGASVSPSPSTLASPTVSASAFTPRPSVTASPLQTPKSSVSFSPTPAPTPSLLPTLAPTPTPSIPVRNAENWAGYITYSDMQAPQPLVTGVSASWVVPSVAPTLTDAYSAAWIGIGGGPSDPSLIQIGTEHDFVGGQASYTCWYERLPSRAFDITSISVSPGDQMQASIRLVNDPLDEWALNITDVTNGQTFQRNFFYGASRLSADWVVERPKVNGVLTPLVGFGSISFTGCEAIVNGVSGGIGSFAPLKLDLFSSTAPGTNGVPLASTSGLSLDGTSFSVSYLASG